MDRILLWIWELRRFSYGLSYGFEGSANFLMDSKRYGFGLFWADFLMD